MNTFGKLKIFAKKNLVSVNVG